MGVIYKINCERCNTLFEHQAGMGFMCTCRDCGDFGDDNAPFFCPVCNRRYTPSTEEFSKAVVEVTHWD